MKINFYINLVFSLMFLLGCGAYFNTFYNAQKSFDDAEKIIDKSKKEYDSDIPQQAKKLLSHSIEKSQKVIDEYPHSQWIDDSYFLIGKSSFIKADYEYSEKYFRKILNEYPNSNLFIETKLWLSYTLLKKAIIDSAIVYINSFQDESKLTDEHKFLKYTILAEIDLFNKKFESAYINFEKSINYLNNDGKKSSIFEKLVKISENQIDTNKTIYFLDKLNRYSQNEDIKHESKLKWLKYNRESGDLDLVRTEIDKLLTMSEYEKVFLSLELEKVKILLSDNKFELAKDNLLYIVENNSKKKETAEAYYLLGLYYLKNEWDLDKAKEYFSNVKIEYSRSIYLDNAIDLKNTIEKYQGLTKIFESQKTGDTTMVEFTIDEEEKMDLSLDFGSGGYKPNLPGYSNPNLNFSNFEEENLSSVTIKGTIDSLIFAMGEILYFDFQQLDSAESKFNYLYNNHPDSKFTPQAIYILSNTVNDSLLWENKLIDEYPDNQFSKALQGIEIDINDNYLFENQIDSLWDNVELNPELAAKQFISISESYKDSKSLYSAAFVYDYYLNDISNSIKYYNFLIDSFPDSELNSKAKIRLEMIQNAINDTITIKQDTTILDTVKILTDYNYNVGPELPPNKIDEIVLDKVVDFDLKDLNKKKYNTKDLYKDGPILMYFWNLACEPCKKEMIFLNEFEQKYKKYKFNIITVNMDTPRSLSKVKSYIKSKQFSFKVLNDSRSQFFRQIGGTIMPYTIMVDTLGIIKNRYSGYNFGDEIEREKEIVHILDLEHDTASCSYCRSDLANLEKELELNNDKIEDNVEEYENSLILNNNVDSLLDQKFLERIDSLESTFITPLKDDVKNIDYDIDEIIHWNDHIIKKGETLEAISNNYYQNIQMVDSIFAWNYNVLNNDKNVIYPYTIIKLKSDKIINKANYFNEHIIVSGQTLWSISKEKFNDPYAWILIFNDNKDLLINGANNLKPGIIIKIRDIGIN